MVPTTICTLDKLSVIVVTTLFGRFLGGFELVSQVKFTALNTFLLEVAMVHSMAKLLTPKALDDVGSFLGERPPIHDDVEHGPYLLQVLKFACTSFERYNEQCTIAR